MPAPRVGGGHAHGAQPDAADVEGAESDVFHVAASYPSQTDMSSGG